MRIEFDDSELRRLEVDISEAPGRLQRNFGPTMKRGARLVEREMKRDASGHRYLPHLADATSHDVLGPWEAEIGLGPDGGQGSLAHIIVYGSVNNDPVYDHTAGLRRAEPRIVKMFADTAEESVLGDDE